jgi:hypothetical protein
LTLKIDSRVDRCGDTLKLRQNGIPRLVDLLASMRRNHIGKQVEASIEFSVGFLLIESRKSAITGNICVEDGGELVLHHSVSDTRKNSD